MENMSERKNRASNFITFVIDRAKNKGTAAALRRADNPATEYQSWEYLANFVNLDKSWERLPFATIAAAAVKTKLVEDGNVGIGQAIAMYYKESGAGDQAKAKLRRLLACDSVEEACRILRPIFSLIESKGSIKLNFARLLDELLRFHWDSQRTRIKSIWAQGFYNHASKEEDAA
jgi:CRISPR system Cascade subunit CasB